MSLSKTRMSGWPAGTCGCIASTAPWQKAWMRRYVAEPSHCAAMATGPRASSRSKRRRASRIELATWSAEKSSASHGKRGITTGMLRTGTTSSGDR